MITAVTALIRKHVASLHWLKGHEEVTWVTEGWRGRSDGIPPALYRECLSGGLSCSPGECPGIERGFSEEGVKTRRQTEIKMIKKRSF